MKPQEQTKLINTNLTEAKPAAHGAPDSVLIGQRKPICWTEARQAIHHTQQSSYVLRKGDTLASSRGQSQPAFVGT